MIYKLSHEWVLEFEIIYCDWNLNRLHFVHQCVHSLTHLARETRRLGALWLSSQWTMEHVIGYLGSLLWQLSNLFRNLLYVAVSASHVTLSCDCGNFSVVYSSIDHINANAT